MRPRYVVYEELVQAGMDPEAAFAKAYEGCRDDTKRDARNLLGLPIAKTEVKRVVAQLGLESGTCRCALIVLDHDGACIMERGDPPYKLCFEGCPMFMGSYISDGDTLILYSDDSVELIKQEASK